MYCNYEVETKFRQDVQVLDIGKISLECGEEIDMENG